MENHYVPSGKWGKVSLKDNVEIIILFSAYFSYLNTLLGSSPIVIAYYWHLEYLVILNFIFFTLFYSPNIRLIFPTTCCIFLLECPICTPTSQKLSLSFSFLYSLLQEIMHSVMKARNLSISSTFLSLNAIFYSTFYKIYPVRTILFFPNNSFQMPLFYQTWLYITWYTDLYCIIIRLHYNCLAFFYLLYSTIISL